MASSGAIMHVEHLRAAGVNRSYSSSGSGSNKGILFDIANVAYYAAQNFSKLIDIDARLTSARALNLDNLANANILNIPNLAALSPTLIGYLSNLNNSNLLNIPNLATLTAAKIGYMVNLNNSNLLNIPDLSSLSSTLIGYLANLNNINILNLPDLSTLTTTLIGYLANINNANLLSIPDWWAPTFIQTMINMLEVSGGVLMNEAFRSIVKGLLDNTSLNYENDDDNNFEVFFDATNGVNIYLTH